MCDQESDADIQRLVTLNRLSQWADEDRTRTGPDYSPGSVDCGYFCAVALQMLYFSGGRPLLRQMMSRAEVYQLRETFLQRHRRLPARDVCIRHRHEGVRALDPLAATEYLAYLGLSGFHRVPAAGALTTQNFRARITALMRRTQMAPGAPALPPGSPERGIMFARITTGHWFAILRAAVHAGSEQWCPCVRLAQL